MIEAKLRELGLPVPADPVEVGAGRRRRHRLRSAEESCPRHCRSPMSSRPSAEELREAAAADHVMDVEDAEIGEVPAAGQLLGDPGVPGLEPG